MKQKDTIYLACPYTFNPELSFEICNFVGAKLMEQGYIVFSPISHSHPISKMMKTELANDHDFWLSQDLPFMDICDYLYVIDIKGMDGMNLIKESRGCQKEIRNADRIGVEIVYYEYYN